MIASKWAMGDWLGVSLILILKMDNIYYVKFKSVRWWCFAQS